MIARLDRKGVVLATAAVLAATVMVITACTPAAPANPTHTLSPTPKTIWRSDPDGTKVPLNAPFTPTPVGTPTPPGYGLLQDGIEWERENPSGARTKGTEEYLQVFITFDTVERMREASVAAEAAEAIVLQTHADEMTLKMSVRISDLKALTEALFKIGGMTDVAIPRPLDRTGSKRQGESTPGTKLAT